MIAFLMGPLGKWLGAAAVLIALVAGFNVWLINHDHAVKAALVQFYEAKATEAAAAEQKRQAAAAKAAADNFQKQLTETAAAQAKAQADLEKGIAQYEARLVAAKRACLLDDSDLQHFGVMHH